MKRRKIRGTRTCGGGAHKKRRGGGSRGGRGNAGAYAHHFVKSLKMGIRKGDRGRGFYHHPAPRILRTINVGELDEMVEALIVEGKAEEKNGGIYIDASNMGIDKILGRGKVTKRLIVSVAEISETAKEKIEAAGGEVILR
ncbi:MAG: uL15m family ribosomal protein [Candidatus Methanospirareceae archaeon]